MAAKKQYLNRILLKSLVKSFFYIEIKVVTILLLTVRDFVAMEIGCWPADRQ